jgi:hypothetical protein
MTDTINVSNFVTELDTIKGNDQSVCGILELHHKDGRYAFAFAGEDLDDGEEVCVVFPGNDGGERLAAFLERSSRLIRERIRQRSTP